MTRSSEGARDVSLCPRGEVDLVPIVLSAGGSINLSDPATFVQPLTGSPLMLVIKVNGLFYEGQYAPDASKNIQREANAWHEICVRDRPAWYFLPDSGTVTIKGKVLLDG